MQQQARTQLRVLLGSCSQDQEAVPRSQLEMKRTPRPDPKNPTCAKHLPPQRSQPRRRTERSRIKGNGGGSKKGGMSALYFSICARGSRVSLFGHNFTRRRRRKNWRKTTGDITEQEDEPYFNPEFRSGFLVVLLWSLCQSALAACGCVQVGSLPDPGSWAWDRNPGLGVLADAAAPVRAGALILISPTRRPQGTGFSRRSFSSRLAGLR